MIEKMGEKLGVYGVNPFVAIKNILARKDEKLLKSAAIEGSKKVFDLFEQNLDTREILKYRGI